MGTRISYAGIPEEKENLAPRRQAEQKFIVSK
jgi:hypothetical protein